MVHKKPIYFLKVELLNCKENTLNTSYPRRELTSIRQTTLPKAYTSVSCLEGSKLNQGLRAKLNPILALFSMALVSTSLEMVMSDLGRHSCWIRALALPELVTRPFTVVNGSNACWVPRVKVFSLVENLWLMSTPTAVLDRGLIAW